MIFVEFSDQQTLPADCGGGDPWAPGTTDPPSWSAELFESPGGPQIPQSLTNYYREMSGGAHLLYGEVFPRVIRMEEGIPYWRSHGELVNQAVIDSADAYGCDFSQFDTFPSPSGDGVVDFIFIYYRAIRTLNAGGVNLFDDGGKATLGNAVSLQRDGVTLDLESGARLNPPQVHRSFWTTIEIAQHEYGHHLTNLVYYVTTAGHLSTIGRYGVMQGDLHGNGPQIMSSLIRRALGWVVPTVLVPGQDLQDGVPLTVTLEDIGSQYGAGLLEVRTSDPLQCFLLEVRDSTGSVFTAGGDCPFEPASSGMLIAHVNERPRYSSTPTVEPHTNGWFRSGGGAYECLIDDCGLFPDPPCLDEKYPPLIDVEVATGKRDSTTWAPDPVAGVDKLAFPETGTSSRGSDLFRNGSREVSLMTPYTNPSTNLYWYATMGEDYYDSAYCEVRRKQTVWSGLSFYNIRWVVPPGGGAGQMSVDILWESTPGTAHRIADGTRWEGDVQLMGDVVVEAGGKLEIAPGTRVIAAADQDNIGGDSKVELLVRGECEAEGTYLDPVEFTSSRDPTVTHFLSAGETTPPAAGDWLGMRIDVTGAEWPSYGYFGCAEKTSAFSNGEVKYAEHAFQVEDFCAPTIDNVSFSSNAEDIRLEDTDVFIPSGYWQGPSFVTDPATWNLSAPTKVVATTTSSNQATWKGSRNTNLIELWNEGNLLTGGGGGAQVTFESTAKTAATGADWAGIRLEPASMTNLLHQADIGYATTPVSAMWVGVTGSEIADCSIHHFRDLGIELTGGRPIRVAGCTIERGVGLLSGFARRGLSCFETSPVIEGNQIGAMTEFGVYAQNPLAFCSGAPAVPETLRVSGNTLAGPASSAGEIGLRLEGVCDNRNGEVRLNEISSWGTGIEMHQCAGVEVTCNNVEGNLIGADLSRTYLANGPAVLFGGNRIAGSDDHTVRTDNAQKAKLGSLLPSPTLGLNALQLQTDTKFFVTQNDSFSTQVLDARRNFWRHSSGLDETDSTWVRARMYTESSDPTATDRIDIALLQDQAAIPGYSACYPGGGSSALAAGTSELVTDGLVRPDLEHSSGSESEPPSNGLGVPSPLPAAGLVRFELSVVGSGTQVQVDVYDIHGRRVRRLVSAELGPGRYPLSWDRQDQGMKVVADGVYFLRASIGGEVFHRKVVLTR